MANQKKEVVKDQDDNVMALDAGAGVVSMFFPIGIYKLNPDAKAPEYSTDGSMCFDIKACFTSDEEITYYSKNNIKMSVKPGIYDRDTMNHGFPLEPGARAMVPTGLIFDLPADTAMKLYPRSGQSLKSAIKLGNCTAVIDSDYVEQTYIILENASDVRVIIMNGERVCQGEVVQVPPKAQFTEMNKRPAQKTKRNGGLGSTGK